jgi:hypothetical protein
VGEEKPVQKGLEGPRHPAVVDRGTQDKPIGLNQLIPALVYRVIVKGASPGLPALPAIYAAPDILVPHMDMLYGDPLFFQFPGEDLQAPVYGPPGMGASI